LIAGLINFLRICNSAFFQISRLIGTHELILLNYYSYIARFLTPHQREVIHLLQYSAQVTTNPLNPGTNAMIF
jgi:hypothetical protein